MTLESLDEEREIRRAAVKAAFEKLDPETRGAVRAAFKKTAEDLRDPNSPVRKGLISGMQAIQLLAKRSREEHERRNNT